MFLGSTGWWLLLVAAVSAPPRLSAAALRWIEALSGITLLAFAASTALSAWSGR